MLTVAFQWEEGADRSFGLPAYETDGAAGADLRANFPDRGVVMLEPGARALVPTGLRLAVPAGYEVQLRPRSGLALKYGITLPNSPGTIESDYRGALGVIVMNAGEEPFELEHGARIAQMVVAPVVQARFEAVESLGPPRAASVASAPRENADAAGWGDGGGALGHRGGD